MLVVWVTGSYLFAKIDGIAYVVLSIIYAKKKTWDLGLVSPLVRGLQTLAMVGAICGYNQLFPWLAMGLMVARNILGDLRDAQEDAAEGKWTIPAMLGMKSRPFAHLLGMFATTIAWWLYAANLSGWLLVIILFVEVGTYWLTPRRSNPKVTDWKILCHLRR